MTRPPRKDNLAMFWQEKGTRSSIIVVAAILAVIVMVALFSDRGGSRQAAPAVSQESATERRAKMEMATVKLTGNAARLKVISTQLKSAADRPTVKRLHRQLNEIWSDCSRIVVEMGAIEYHARNMAIRTAAGEAEWAADECTKAADDMVFTASGLHQRLGGEPLKLAFIE